MHIHVAVTDLENSIGFYSTMFGTEPVIKHQDYAKWQMDDPAVNFAISDRGQVTGINHLGIQVDSENELQEIAQRLENAEITFSSQQGTSCCYANSNKHWAMDPQGIAWESFHNLGDIPTFSENAISDTNSESSACCIPLIQSELDDDTAACCVAIDNKTGEENNKKSSSSCC